MEENKKYATCKEFGKMLRAVADIFAQYGNKPLEDFGPINIELKGKTFYVTNRGAYQDFIQPWVSAFMDEPIDVTAAIKWAKQIKDKERK